MNTELSDEQLGRLWCKRHGKRPTVDAESQWWQWGWSLPTLLAGYCGGLFETEAGAYSAVGQALRRVIEVADEVRSMGGVK